MEAGVDIDTMSVSSGGTSRIVVGSPEDGRTDPPDMVYMFIVRACDTCDHNPSEENPFYMKAMLRMFARTPAMHRRRFWTWARYDSKGSPESACCALCAFMAYHGRKSSGGEHIFRM